MAEPARRLSEAKESAAPPRPRPRTAYDEQALHRELSQIVSRFAPDSDPKPATPEREVVAELEAALMNDFAAVQTALSDSTPSSSPLPDLEELSAPRRDAPGAPLFVAPPWRDPRSPGAPIEPPPAAGPLRAHAPGEVAGPSPVAIGDRPLFRAAADRREFGAGADSEPAAEAVRAPTPRWVSRDDWLVEKVPPPADEPAEERRARLARAALAAAAALALIGGGAWAITSLVSASAKAPVEQTTASNVVRADGAAAPAGQVASLHPAPSSAQQDPAAASADAAGGPPSAGVTKAPPAADQAAMPPAAERTGGLAADAGEATTPPQDRLAAMPAEDQPVMPTEDNVRRVRTIVIRPPGVQQPDGQVGAAATADPGTGTPAAASATPDPTETPASGKSEGAAPAAVNFDATFGVANAADRRVLAALQDRFGTARSVPAAGAPASAAAVAPPQTPAAEAPVSESAGPVGAAAPAEAAGPSGAAELSGATPTPEARPPAAPPEAPSAPPAAASQWKAALAVIPSGPTQPAMINTDVNMRAGPDNDAPAIVVIRRGSQIQVVAGCTHWCEVVAGDKRGFVYKRYISAPSRPARGQTATANRGIRPQAPIRPDRS